MHERLGHAKKHKSDAHAGGKKHRKPRDIFVLRLYVIGSQFDLAKLAKAKDDDA